MVTQCCWDLFENVLTLRVALEININKTDDMGNDMSPRMQHYMNPLHIYCRLKDLGVPKKMAIFLCRIYESCIYGRFFRNSLNRDL